MAIHKSVKRQERRSLRRNEVNRQNQSKLRTQVKRMREALDSKDKETIAKTLPPTQAVIDRMVKKGTIHPKKGNRFKSRLSRQAGQITAGPSK